MFFINNKKYITVVINDRRDGGGPKCRLARGKLNDEPKTSTNQTKCAVEMEIQN